MSRSKQEVALPHFQLRAHFCHSHVFLQSIPFTFPALLLASSMSFLHHMAPCANSSSLAHPSFHSPDLPGFSLWLLFLQPLFSVFTLENGYFPRQKNLSLHYILAGCLPGNATLSPWVHSHGHRVPCWKPRCRLYEKSNLVAFLMLSFFQSHSF